MALFPTGGRARQGLALAALVAGVVVLGNGRSIAKAPLPRIDSLTYLGAFDVPPGQFGTSRFEPFSYGGSAIGYNAANNSLFVVGHVQDQLLAEISIPSLGGTATVLQNFVDPTAGRINDINPTDPNSKRIGGTLVFGSNLIVSAYSYYDGNGTQALSHFVRSKTLSNSTVTGPLQVGTMSFCSSSDGGHGSGGCAGFYSGYMGVVPQEWQTALGGPAITGNASLGIISRTSYGPAIFAFDPDAISSTGAVPLLYYNSMNRTLGPYEAAGEYWGGSDTIRGVAIVPGSSTILFFGRHGETYCYGYGTSDPALDRQPRPPDLDPWCYDPTDSAKGVHGYPYNSFVWMYDLNDLAAVRAGTRTPWSVLPYKTLKLTTTMGAEVGGATIDPATGRIYIIEQFATPQLNPVVRVYTASSSSASFTDSVLTPNVSVIKAVHVQELRTRINALRAARSLAAYQWTDSTLTAGSSVLKAVHILELREALRAVYTSLGRTVTYAEDLAAGGVVKASHITELRDAVLSAE